MLYTNSPAAHSGLMREFSDNVSRAPSNALVVCGFQIDRFQFYYLKRSLTLTHILDIEQALKRRFQNVLNDPQRQIQYEMLLGIQEYFFIAVFKQNHFPHRFYKRN